MIRTGRVVEKDQDLLKICFEKTEACESCGLCGRQEAAMTVSGSAEVGDSVDVELPDAQVLKASLMAYAVPLAGLVAGLWLGSALFPGREGLALVTGIAGLLLFFAGVKLFDKRLRRSAAWQPRVVAVRPAEKAPSPKAQG